MFNNIIINNLKYRDISSCYFSNKEPNSIIFIHFQWNISDYFYQNRIKIAKALNQSQQANKDNTDVSRLLPFDSLWMCVFSSLGELCIDMRPAARKSAGQTLFSTVSAHGSLLQHSTWQIVLWKVSLVCGWIVVQSS